MKSPAPGVPLTFPLREELEPLESGYGYVLRMALLNSVTGIPAVKTLLGKTTGAALSSTDAAKLSEMFGASADLLGSALGSPADGPGPKMFGGHLLSKPTFYNRTAPRVCPTCLEQNGYCSLVWEFAMVSACAQHRTNLVDHCAHCGSRVRWVRPSVSTCRCMATFSVDVEAQPPTAAELEFARWIELQLEAAHPRQELRAAAQESLRSVQAQSNLMRLVWPLSLNGGLLIITALRVAARQAGAPREVERRALAPLHRARMAIVAANEVAQAIAEERFDGLRLKSQATVGAIIAESMAGSAPEVDRHFALSLLSVLAGRYQRQRWPPVVRQHFQQELF